jgi:hypothetical protein
MLDPARTVEIISFDKQLCSTYLKVNKKTKDILNIFQYH